MNCKLLSTALFQESAWSIVHSIPNDVKQGKEIRLALDEDNFLVHLDKFEDTDRPCEWEDMFEDLVVIP